MFNTCTACRTRPADGDGSCPPCAKVHEIQRLVHSGALGNQYEVPAAHLLHGCFRALQAMAYGPPQPAVRQDSRSPSRRSRSRSPCTPRRAAPPGRHRSGAKHRGKGKEGSKGAGKGNRGHKGDHATGHDRPSDLLYRASELLQEAATKY